MASNESRPALDAEGIKALISKLQPEEIEIFRSLMVDVRTRGAGMSPSDISALAKQYADKARNLAGEGGR